MYISDKLQNPTDRYSSVKRRKSPNEDQKSPHMTTAEKPINVPGMTHEKPMNVPPKKIDMINGH